MNEAMEMLRELIEKVGMTGEQAWPFVVRHVQASAMAQLIGGVLCLVISIAIGLLVRRAYVNCPRHTKDQADPNYYGRIAGQRDWDDSAAITCVIASVLAVILFGMGLGLSTGALPDLIEPTGATIRAIVGR